MLRTVIALAAALVVAGCSSAPAASPSPSTAISDAEYLQLVRSQGWTTPNMADANLLKAGSLACDAITSTPPDGRLTNWMRAVDVSTAGGVMTGSQAGEFLVYASARFCPDARDAYFPKV